MRAVFRTLAVIAAVLVIYYWAYPRTVRLYDYLTAESSILEVPAFPEIKEFYPDLYAKILSDTKSAIIKGGSVDDIISENGMTLAALLEHDLPLASPEATSAFITSFVGVFRKAGNNDPECCVELINGNEQCMWQLMTPEEQNDLLRAIALIIRSAHTGPAELNDVKQAEKDVGRISSNVVAKFGPEIDYTAQTPLTDEEKKKVCFAIADLYSETLKLPPARSSDAIKYLLSGPGEEEQQ
ncbi:MAG: hypothetical protein A3J42_00615 [Candidatus Dadabacteria bacterium RIFCSPHIGHO2_12_FULL_53_21]|nr:MAG: hypothetical protein A3J42_00615 [Candidatus Dadabacteria bacterium RIFCSPHIGHO2_12_FULL_53_21]